jgi:hypothetical protein
MSPVGAPDRELLVHTTALGCAAASAIVRRPVTEREPMAGFARYLG